MSITPVESWIRPVDERFSIVQGHTQRITAEDLVGTDTGLNGSVISLQSVNQPAHGSLVLNGDGSYVYSPATGYVGADSFSYRANDGTTNSNIATVNLTVNAGQTFPGTPGDDNLVWVSRREVETDEGRRKPRTAGRGGACGRPG